uniref:Uncharacterized protein n=1 Tax=Phenylobacterium glaciei TaxID=2803784 RepID=A0A974S9T1_9CAUL|nr:hypothetical protein JKL49_08915 [Phenylobacterium glaciei]
MTCAAAISGYNPATFVSNFGTGRSSLPLLQGGNPKLGPETANTYQVGVVVEPASSPTFRCPWTSSSTISRIRSGRFRWPPC